MNLQRSLWQRLVVTVAMSLIIAAWSRRAEATSFTSSSVRAEKVTIPVADGSRLKGEVLIPPSFVRGSAGIHPAVVFLNPFGQGYGVYLKAAQIYAERGFFVLLFNPRGWHGSEGHTTFDYRILVKDNAEVLDWFQAQYAVESGRIGLIGISEGGGLALLTAASDPRVGAVAGFSAWSDLSHPSLGDTTRTMWTGILSGLTLVFGEFGRMLRESRQEELDDPTGQMRREKMQGISPIHHLGPINARKIPIFLSHNFDDVLFPVNQMLDFYQNLTGPKRLVVNSGFHALTEMLALSHPSDGLWDDAYRWFDQWLKGGQKTIDDGISFALKNGTGAVQLKGEGSASSGFLTYHATVLENGRKVLVSEVQEKGVGADPILLKSPWWHGGAVHTGIPLWSAYRVGSGGGPIRVNLSRLKEPTTIAFVSGEQNQDTTLLGVPHVKIAFHSVAPRGQIVAHLMDVAPDGSTQLVTHGVWSWWAPSVQNWFEREMELYGVAWELKKGHKLILAFDTRDLEYWPPELRAYELELSGEASAIQVQIPYQLENQDF